MLKALRTIELTPPDWCSTYDGDEASCDEAYVQDIDGFYLCEYKAGKAKCKTPEISSCPSPPAPPPMTDCEVKALRTLELTPPSWCSTYNGDEVSCDAAYVLDGDVFHLCKYIFHEL